MVNVPLKWEKHLADAPAILTELRNELGALREAFGLPIEADA